MIGEPRVIVHEMPGRMRTDVYFMLDERTVLEPTEKIEYQKRILEPDFPIEDIKPILSLSYMDCERILKALVETLEKRGIKTESGHKLEGKLEATEYHLEDLRKLLKLGTTKVGPSYGASAFSQKAGEKPR